MASALVSVVDIFSSYRSSYLSGRCGKLVYGVALTVDIIAAIAFGVIAANDLYNFESYIIVALGFSCSVVVTGVQLFIKSVMRYPEPEPEPVLRRYPDRVDSWQDT